MGLAPGWLVLAGLLGYEMLNLNTDTALDVNDVAATVAFGTISAIVYALILRKHGVQDSRAKGLPESTSGATGDS